MNIRNLSLALATAVLGLAAGTASAGSTQGSFDVSATVSGSCVITSAQAIAFGNYDPTAAHASADLDGAGAVAVRCTAGSTNVLVSLDQGQHADAASSAEAPLRRMSSGDDFISYSLFKDAGRSEVWGAGGSADNVIAEFTSSLVPVDLTTYGRIAGGQNASIGTYTDTVGINVTF